MKKKIFCTFTAVSEDALNAKVEAYIRKNNVKEVHRSAPSISIAFRDGETRLEPYVILGITSTFKKEEK